MDKKTVAVTVAVTVIIAASAVYVLLQKNEPTNQPSSIYSSQETAEEKPSAQQEAAGVYVDYSSELLASTKGIKLLFFHAPWCPQCRALDESIKNSDLPDGVTIFKVDYDSNQALRAKYGVTLQTTVVKVDDDGNKLASYVAYDEPTFDNVKQALLP